MLTASINPVQLIVISKALIDKKIIFLLDLNMSKKSLIFPENIININRNINDHNPLCKATSKAGTNFISLKNSGWGIPQKIEAKTV